MKCAFCERSTRSLPIVNKMAITHVLTNPTLLKHVCSYQSGIPVPAGKLLERYQAEHDAIYRPWYWLDIDTWLASVVPKAIALYNDFEVLDLMWCPEWHSELCEQACVFGRLGMLQCLYAAHEDERCIQSNAITCATKGQLHMLEWLYSRYSKLLQNVLRELNCARVAGGGHLNVLRWLMTRRFGRLQTRILINACHSGNLELVQFLLAQPLPLLYYRPLIYERPSGMCRPPPFHRLPEKQPEPPTIEDLIEQSRHHPHLIKYLGSLLT